MKQHNHPCNECPFRKNSLPLHLGQFSAEETKAIAHSDLEFMCHLTRGKKNPSHCVGRMLYATKNCKSFWKPEMENERKRVKKLNTLDNILCMTEFLPHHSEEGLKRFLFPHKSKQ